MLDSIRQNAQSWGVKIAFGLIIVVFVFWGAGSMMDSSNNSAVVAMVDEQPIMIQDFLKLYQQQVEMYKAQGINEESLKQFGLKQQILQQLITRQLIITEAERQGIEVTPQELKREIASISLFRNVNDEFDPTIYTNMLKAQGQTPGQFEAAVRDELLISKVKEYVTMTASVTPEEARNVFNYEGEKRAIDVVLFPAADYLKDAKVSPEALQAFYDANREQFRIPQRVSLDYILVTPKSLAKNETVGEEEIAAFYAENAETFFQQEEMVKARHILFTVNKGASEAEVESARKKAISVMKKAKAGQDFAALAKKYSQGPSAPLGGDLGSFGKNRMVKPFEDAAFALNVGEVSEPVRTQFGFHVIKVEEHTPSRVKTLDEVRDDITMRLAADKAADKVMDTLDAAIEQVASGKSIADVAVDMNLELRSSPEFDATKATQIVGLTGSSIETVFNTPAGTPIDTPLEVEGGYMIARVSTNTPADYIPLEQVKPAVQGRLLQQEAMSLSTKAAKEMEATIQSEGMPADLEAKAATTALFGRDGFIPGIGQNPELANAVFVATDAKWIGPFESARGAVFVRLNKTVTPSDADWDAVKAQFLKASLAAKKRELFGAFMNTLGKKAKIEMRNAAVLQ